MRPTPTLATLFATLSVLSACATDPELTIDGFDATCSEPEDCMAVLVGNVCGCACDYAAINVAEADAWADYDADLRDDCVDPVDCSPCPDATVTCDSGTCSATAATE